MIHKYYAESVAKIAHEYARRERNGVAHTGHTVNRLLEAVSKLIGHRVSVVDVGVRVSDRVEDILEGKALYPRQVRKHGSGGSSTR